MEQILSRNVLHVHKIPVTTTPPEKLTQQIIHHALAGCNRYVCLGNAHMLVTANNSPCFLRILQNAEAVAPDGLPLVWLLRHKGFRGAQRVTGTDLTVAVCIAAAKKGIPVSFYGSTSETLTALQNIVSRRFPNLKTVAFESLPMLPDRPEVDIDVVQRIRSSGSRIVFVGLGCPKQEFWMAAHSPHLPAVLIGVGAAFDFLAGTVKRAPLWVQKCGMEWFYRLCHEPSRLWKRYLITNSLFALMVLKEILGGRNHRSRNG